MRDYFVQDAVCLVDKARKNLKAGNPLCGGELMSLDTLAKQIQLLRNEMLLYDLSKGLPGKDAALKYNLSPARVSQIKRSATA